jgi:hypothetical protein
MPTNRWHRGVGRFVRYVRLLSWAAFFVLSLAQISASETFKDEAGRVIYIIDENGVVSMFENSPGIDITISVTRGTRDEMQPQITELSPESVPAGAPAVLRMKGKNLVGATVKFSTPGIEIGTYAARPKSLDVPISVPADVQPGPITVEVSTPIGMAKTSFKVSEMRIGGTAQVKPDSAGKGAISTAAPASCPEGMVGVAAERGGFCIEIDQSFAADYQKAEKACAISGKRLCQVAEWRAACELVSGGKVPLKNMIGHWEWTGTQVIKERPGEAADYGATGELRSILMGQSDCKTERDYQTWRTETIAGRCCK